MPCVCVAFYVSEQRDNVSVILTGERHPAATMLMAVLSFAPIHRRAHELGRDADASERGVNLAEPRSLKTFEADRVRN